MGKKVLICVKPKDAKAKKAAEELTSALRKSGVEIAEIAGSREPIENDKVKSVSLGVVIGGDGTFLSVVRRLPKKDQFPLIGINVGRLGFITEVGSDQMVAVIQDALKSKLDEERRQLLEIDLIRGGKKIQSGTIFNDAAITKEARTTMVHLAVYVGSEFLSKVRADGYIVSTATGSTAYALSAGGPLLHPAVSALVLLPICAHSLSARPVLVPIEEPIEIHVEKFNGNAFLVFDGQVNFELKEGDTVRLSKANSSLRLVRPQKNTWAQAVRSKLRME